jgi:hypothetical protein
MVEGRFAGDATFVGDAIMFAFLLYASQSSETPTRPQTPPAPKLLYAPKLRRALLDEGLLALGGVGSRG